MDHGYPHRSAADKWLDRFFASLQGGVPQCEMELRDQVVSLLFRWRVSIPVSVFSSFALAMTAIVTIGATWAAVWAIVDMTLGAARWRLVSMPGLNTMSQRARGTGWLTLMGLAWASMLGMAAALSLLSGNMTLTMLAVTTIAGAVGVVSFRNAPTPRAAKIMILVLALPISVAGILAENDAVLAVTIFTLPWCLMLFFLVQQNFDVFCGAARTKIHLHEVARTDPLTGLSNRLLFAERVDELTDMPAGCTASIACLHLDGFKQINDKYGHDVGDHLLQSVADRLSASIRKNDDVFRLGGDEFAIIMHNTPLHEADRVIDRIITEVGHDYDLGRGIKVRVGVSVGSAECLGGSGDMAEVLRAADRALYRAKEQGRGRHVHIAAAR
jgi:diguanylate cyclase (GGDEF)-like protein